MAGKPQIKDLFVVIDINDKYELPLFVGSLQEVADYCNTNTYAIRSAICHAKRRGSKCRYVRVKV